MIELALYLATITLLVSLIAAYPLYRRGVKKVALLMVIAITGLTAGGYVLWGSPRVVPLASEYHDKTKILRHTIEVSEKLIKQDTDNLEAWLTLAQAFADAGDYKAAANAYKQCVLLSKGNPLIIMAYAEALIASDNGVVGAQAKKSIDIALMIDKELPVARYYKAIWLLQNNEAEAAMKTMKTLYHELPDDSALKRKMNEQIGR